MEVLIYCWPEIAFFVLLVGAGTVVIRRVWLLRERALLFVLPLCFLVAIALDLLVFAFCWNGTTYSSLTKSPTGTFEVRVVAFRGTAIDIPTARIIVRSHGSSFWHMAYEGLWFGDEKGGPSPYVTWVNPQLLRIKVPADDYTSGECKSPSDGVTINCEPQKESR